MRDQGLEVFARAALLHVDDGCREEAGAGLQLLTGRILTTFDGFLEQLELAPGSGLPSSSCASVHSDPEVFAADRPVRRFARAGRLELKRHRSSSRIAAR